MNKQRSGFGTLRQFARCSAMSGVGSKADLPVERPDLLSLTPNGHENGDQLGRASMTLNVPAGNTRMSSKPDLSKRAAYSSLVRSRPPGAPSMLRSLNFPGSSFGGATVSEAEGLLENVEGKYRITEVAVRPRVTLKGTAELERAREIMDSVEAQCFISNLIKSKVTLTAEFVVVARPK